MPQTPSEILKSEMEKLNLKTHMDLARFLGYSGRYGCNGFLVQILSGKILPGAMTLKRFKAKGIIIPVDVMNRAKQDRHDQVKTKKADVPKKHYPSFEPIQTTPCGMEYYQGMKCSPRNSASDCTYCHSRIISGERRYSPKQGQRCPAWVQPEDRRRYGAAGSPVSANPQFSSVGE
jgi:hypothetical protein